MDDQEHETTTAVLEEEREEPVTRRAPRPRGFATMAPEKVRAIARLGGKAAHACGRAHRFSSDEARAAGKKGGSAPHARRGRQP